MNVATIPPGGIAYAHIHVDFEVMLYILAGRVLVNEQKVDKPGTTVAADAAPRPPRGLGAP